MATAMFLFYLLLFLLFGLGPLVVALRAVCLPKGHRLKSVPKLLTIVFGVGPMQMWVLWTYIGMIGGPLILAALLLLVLVFSVLSFVGFDLPFKVHEEVVPTIVGIIVLAGPNCIAAFYLYVVATSKDKDIIN